MKKIIVALSIVTAACPTLALGQALEEIIVTAQRREQRLQDVPVSITAFTEEQLKRANIEETKDYFLLTPNVSFTEDGEAGQRSVGLAIRGISDFSNALTDFGGQSNSFGIYLDEFNVANSANKTANPQLQDLRSVEILRGPQGTYFGRNATGGALNLSTNLPNKQNYYEMALGYSSFNTKEISAVANTPLTDNLFVRGVAWYEESDNFIRNLSESGSDANYNHNSVRGALRWLPTDRFTVDASVMLTRENDGADTNVNSGVLDADTLGSIPSLLALVPLNDGYFDKRSIIPDFRDRPHGLTSDLLPVDSGAGFFPNNDRYIYKDFKESNTGSSDIINVRLNYSGDAWSIRSITGYLDSEAHRNFDQDVSQYGLYETTRGSIAETFSQELRFNWSNDTWYVTLGGLYADDSLLNFSAGAPIGPDGFAFGTLNPDGTIATCGFCLNPGELIGSRSANTTDGETFAVFGDVTWSFADQWSLIAGARYTRDELEYARYQNFTSLLYSQVASGTRPLDSEITAQDERSFTDVSPRVVLTYAPTDDIDAYLVASAGYKPGGALLDTATRYEEERLWNYEAGIKMQALDDRLTINAAVFHMIWDGLQIPTLDTEFVDGEIELNTRILNIDATAYGAELETQYMPTDYLYLAAGIGYLSNEFDGFGADDPYVFEAMAFDIDGKRLPRSPEWTLNFVGQYERPLTTDYDAFVRVEWSYRSETFSDIEALASVTEPLDIPGFGNSVSGVGYTILYPRDDFPFRVPSFDVVNLRAGVNTDRFSITAYVENLLDDNYYTGTQENFGLGGIRIRPHHRVAGIEFRIFSE